MLIQATIKAFFILKFSGILKVSTPGTHAPLLAPTGSGAWIPDIDNVALNRLYESPLKEHLCQSRELITVSV